MWDQGLQKSSKSSRSPLFRRVSCAYEHSETLIESYCSSCTRFVAASIYVVVIETAERLHECDSSGDRACACSVLE
jgi:hypothetical protein